MTRLGLVFLNEALMHPILAQSEAGAIFLLIAPGARAGVWVRPNCSRK
ncbi:hypothetical protein Ct9H90mP29_09910 [bacterium]|nr:MAG: hypothetical protein Ct9H90mP29_09910 [bacterium]